MSATTPLQRKVQALRESLAGMGSVVVAFSGGVDSTLVADSAFDALGPRALAVTGVSPAVPPAEVEAARTLAAQIGIEHRLIETHEMDDPEYVANGSNRCFHCKDELYGLLIALARKDGYAAVVDGCNVDDTGDFRPGRRAAQEHGVRSPLVEAGMTKDDVREASRRRGLPTWDKPAMACLASRVPYGTPVTLEVLDSVGKAEAYLRSLGLRELRVRHHGEIARIETDAAGFTVLADAATRQRALETLRKIGYRYVTLDLAPFRSGSLNDALNGGQARARG